MKSARFHAPLFLSLSVGLLLLLFHGSATAGCRIDYTFENGSSRGIKIYWLDVKSKGGLWKNIKTDWNMSPGTQSRDVYRAAFSCSAKRRFRFTLTDSRTLGSHGNCNIFYYPSPTGWTTSTDIDFGDLSDHCRSPQEAAEEPDDPVEAGSRPVDPPESPPDGNVLSTAPGAAVPALPGTRATPATPPAATGVSTTAPPTAGDGAAAGQCVVTSTQRFPTLRLRCGGVSIKDQVSRVAEDFMTSCPLVAGDQVKVRVVDGQSRLRIVSRASGGEWCNQVYRPGYYTGPCSAEKNGARKTSVRTLFFRGDRMIDSIIPNRCEPVRLEPGIYRVISEHRVSGAGQASRVTIREAGLRLEGEPLIGNVSTLLSKPIEQR